MLLPIVSAACLCLAMFFSSNLMTDQAFAKALSDPRDKKAEKRAYTQKLRRYIDGIDRVYTRQSAAATTAADIDSLAQDISVKLSQKRKEEFLKANSEFFKRLNNPEHKNLGPAYDDLQALVYKSFKVVRVPSQTPDIGLGAMAYKRHCESCHGLNGKGDGPLSHNPAFPQLTAPTDLASMKEKGTRSPFSYYNHMLIDQHAGLIPNFADQMTHQEIWSVAFFLLGDGLKDAAEVRSKIDEDYPDYLKKLISLEVLATSNDLQLASWLRRQMQAKEGVKSIPQLTSVLRNQSMKNLRFLRIIKSQ